MRLSLGRCMLGFLAVMLCQPAQRSGGGNGASPTGPPNPEIIHVSPDEVRERELQWAHEQNLEDTSRLVKLSTELKWELANHDREVLSVATVKKMDEIERLIRKIRARVGRK